MIKPSSLVIHHPLDAEHASWERVKSLFSRTRGDDMHGLPYPIHFRNLDVLKDWGSLFNANPITQRIWRLCSRAQCSVIDNLNSCKRLLEGLENAKPREFVLDWKALALMPSIHVAVNLTYQQRQGAVIEASPALEVLLTQSDVDPDLPLSMVIPPYSAQYLRFGAHAALALPSPTGKAEQQIDGVFCFSSPFVLADGTTTGEHEFSLVFVLRKKNAFSECITLSSRLKNEEFSMSSWLQELLSEKPSFGNSWNTDHDKAMQVISYVAKVFLYMGLKDARQVAVNALSQPQAEQPKLGKRRQAFMYDRIEVGPESLPQWSATDPSGLAVSPHWRRGHFRLQPYGPQASLRKVMFIMPTIVRADRLA